MYGSFAVRNSTGTQLPALTQVATGLPTGWAPVNYDPLTLLGDGLWSAMNMTVLVSTLTLHCGVALFDGVHE